MEFKFTEMYMLYGHDDRNADFIAIFVCACK